jgi:hypothetical protein
LAEVGEIAVPTHGDRFPYALDGQVLVIASLKVTAVALKRDVAEAIPPGVGLGCPTASAPFPADDGAVRRPTSPNRGGAQESLRSKRRGADSQSNVTYFGREGILHNSWGSQSWLQAGF